MIHVLNGVQSTAAALNAERIRMEVVGQNIANANVTRGLDGKPYQRQQVVFEAMLDRNAQSSNGVLGPESSVQIARIEPDASGLREVYNPTHPHANAQGIVMMPNVNVHQEMVDLISASRGFEANLSVLKTARSMALQTLSLGKR